MPITCKNRLLEKMNFYQCELNVKNIKDSRSQLSTTVQHNNTLIIIIDKVPENVEILFFVNMHTPTP